MTYHKNYVNTPAIDELMAWENGELSGEDTIELFQKLVDSGLAWRLQGVYGRTAQMLIDKGLVEEPERNPRMKWIQKALSHGYRGELHDELGISRKHRIPKHLLDEATRSPGKLGRQARLAETLEDLPRRRRKR